MAEFAIVETTTLSVIDTADTREEAEELLATVRRLSQRIDPSHKFVIQEAPPEAPVRSVG